MYLKVYKEDVIEGLQKAANIIPAKTGAAYLRSIWLNAADGTLSVMATDSNIEFRGTYTAEVTESGLAGVQGRAFVDLLRKLPAGEIVLQLDAEANVLRIEQGRRKYKLPVNDPVWFQNFSDFPADGAVVWSGDFLQELIDRIAFCISDEDAVEAIACLFMKPVAEGRIEACGLNGHQFAMLRFLHDDLHAKLPAEGVLVQKKYLGELKKWLGADEIELNISEKRMHLRTGDGRETFSLPLSSYQYPDYMNFIAKLQGEGVSNLEVDRKEGMDALDRLQIFNSDNNRCTYFDLSGGEVVLTAQGQDVGSASESLEASYDGDIRRIAFPTRNLIDIMNHYQSGRLRLTLTGAEGPCGISGEEDPEYQVIVMPMKIVEETYYSEEEV
ncbi:DNA polymerase III subunit beta [Nitratidesulfovibrio vulgaris]|uniref:Beta sliding clamp n=1 Tax=Nitratidesulfovibrio vulgaris (strain DP4) TaxID=391774 RepID=A0A0H3A6D9_NITV4|nr:DNA polymerase III subunit beta [Nitratidesulfovibrio vulgaris]ABM27030.1 DNA polymerase III, beta subunit [Nitratidesulfovibrio vulgaris DP4]GEB78854.1 DNA polymerase III subunit beta [Desulfovibrio desulfuricans]